jgi:hypothetical protein
LLRCGSFDFPCRTVSYSNSHLNNSALQKIYIFNEALCGSHSVFKNTHLVSHSSLTNSILSSNSTIQFPEFTLQNSSIIRITFVIENDSLLDDKINFLRFKTSILENSIISCSFNILSNLQFSLIVVDFDSKLLVNTMQINTAASSSRTFHKSLFIINGYFTILNSYFSDIHNNNNIQPNTVNFFQSSLIFNLSDLYFRNISGFSSCFSFTLPSTSASSQLTIKDCLFESIVSNSKGFSIYFSGDSNSGFKFFFIIYFFFFFYF